MMSKREQKIEEASLATVNITSARLTAKANITAEVVEKKRIVKIRRTAIKAERLKAEQVRSRTGSRSSERESDI